MAANGSTLQGEITENPNQADAQSAERLLLGLLRALIAEQDIPALTEAQGMARPAAPAATPEVNA